MHQEIINHIFKIFKEKGYVSEDSVYDALINNNVPLDEVDYVCETLLSRGVIIKNDAAGEDDTFVNDRSQTNFEEIYTQVIEVDESLAPFIDDIRMITPPQNREWLNLIPQAQHGNLYARERMVLMYLRIVVKIALYHYQRYNISLSAAIQDGCFGLITAVNKFDIGKQDSFIQYAQWWIRQNIMREAEPLTSFVRHPVYYKEKMFLTYNIILQHKCDLCIHNTICPALITEIEDKLDCNVNEAISWIKSLWPAYSCEDKCENNEEVFSDFGLLVEELDDHLCHKELICKLNQAFSTLDDKERKVLELRFGLGKNIRSKTLEEVGIIFDLTRERIRQIEAKAIKKLRHPSKSKYLKIFW